MVAERTQIPGACTRRAAPRTFLLLLQLLLVFRLLQLLWQRLRGLHTF